MDELTIRVAQRHKAAWEDEDDSPDLSGLAADLGRIPGVEEAQVDEVTPDSGGFWSQVFLKLEVDHAQDVVTRRHAPYVFKVVEFKAPLRAVGHKLKQLVRQAGGYDVRIDLPRKKRTYIDPYGDTESAPKSYYDETHVRLAFNMSYADAQKASR